MTIDEYLKKNRLTQKQFAVLVGVSQGMVGHWISGRHRITPDQATVIEARTNGVLKKEVLVFGAAA